MMMLAITPGNPHSLSRLALLLGLVLPAYLEAAPPPNQDAAVQQVLRKAQGALRQLTEEKAKLEADNAALQKDKTSAEETVAKLEARVKELEPLPAELEKQKAAYAALQAQKTQLESQLSTALSKGTQLHGKLKEIVGKAKLIQQDNQLLVEAVKEREQWIGSCKDKNGQIAQLQGELVQRYEDKGFWEVFKDVEPLTGIGHVETETNAQDFRHRLQDLKTTAFESQLPSEQAEQAQKKPAAPAVNDEDADEE